MATGYSESGESSRSGPGRFAESRIQSHFGQQFQVPNSRIVDSPISSSVPLSRKKKGGDHACVEQAGEEEHFGVLVPGPEYYLPPLAESARRRGVRRGKKLPSGFKAFKPHPSCPVPMPEPLSVGSVYKDEMRRTRRRLLQHERLIYRSSPHLLLPQHVEQWKADKKVATEETVLQERIHQIRRIFHASSQEVSTCNSLPEISKPWSFPKPSQERIKELARPRKNYRQSSRRQEMAVPPPPRGMEEELMTLRHTRQGAPVLRPFGDAGTLGFFKAKAEFSTVGASGWVGSSIALEKLTASSADAPPCPQNERHPRDSRREEVKSSAAAATAQAPQKAKAAPEAPDTRLFGELPDEDKPFDGDPEEAVTPVQDQSNLCVPEKRLVGDLREEGKSGEDRDLGEIAPPETDCPDPDSVDPGSATEQRPQATEAVAATLESSSATCAPADVAPLSTLLTDDHGVEQEVVPVDGPLKGSLDSSTRGSQRPSKEFIEGGNVDLGTEITCSVEIGPDIALK